MQPEDGYLRSQWYGWRDGQMQPCDPPVSLMTPAERAERDERARAMQQRECQSRRGQFTAVTGGRGR